MGTAKMGALRMKLGLTYDSGVTNGHISDIYIWRNEIQNSPNDTMTYYAARVAPDMVEYETVEGLNFMGSAQIHKYITTPHVTFNHKHSDGAEICLARAILALQEAGMNV